MTKAALYAMLLPELRDAAMKQGYVLALHGSLVTCMELIAVPWEECAAEPLHLIEVLQQTVKGEIRDESSQLAHGRLRWIIGLLSAFGQFYLDISVVPPSLSSQPVAPARILPRGRPVGSTRGDGPNAPREVVPVSLVPDKLPGLTLADLTEGQQLIYKRYPTISRWVGKILHAYSPPRILVVKGNATTGRRLTLEKLNAEFRLPYKERE